MSPAPTTRRLALALLALACSHGHAAPGVVAPYLSEFSDSSAAFDSKALGGLARPADAWRVFGDSYRLDTVVPANQDRVHLALVPCPQLDGDRPPGFTLATSVVVDRLALKGPGDRVVDIGLRVLGDASGKKGIQARFVIEGSIGGSAKGTLYLQGTGISPELTRLTAFKFEPGWQYTMVVDATPRADGIELIFTLSDGVAGQSVRAVSRQKPAGHYCGYASRVRTSTDGPHVDLAVRFDKFELTLHPEWVL